jgi:hypothetical protein
MASSVFSNPTPTLTTRVFGEQVEDELVFAIELKTSVRCCSCFLHAFMC